MNGTKLFGLTKTKFNLDYPDGFSYYWHDLRKEEEIFSTRSQGGGIAVIWASSGWGEDDEQITNSSSLPDIDYRFRCLSDNKCTPITSVQSRQLMCVDGADLKRPYDLNQNRWTCNNVYTKCNWIWNCRNAANEANCSNHPCHPDGLPCILSFGQNFTCLPLSKINGGHIDSNMFSLLGTLVLSCYGLPQFLIVLVLFDYFKVFHTALSPIYAHFGETIFSLSTIRAFRPITHFVEHNFVLVSNSIRPQSSSLADSSWLNFRLQLISIIIVAGISLIGVIEHVYAIPGSNPALIELSLSYILPPTCLLNGLILSFTETENNG
ncbi:unnamed protein product [Rotaria socialis]|uniref:Uncharacterized protein n=1 Tax=Rotaria socialis TaxID=392032 RepID=A0A820YF51_9BILA|nr:unnamed protein product [Rotaria socialis]